MCWHDPGWRIFRDNLAHAASRYSCLVPFPLSSSLSLSTCVRSCVVRLCPSLSVCFRMCVYTHIEENPALKRQTHDTRYTQRDRMTRTQHTRRDRSREKGVRQSSLLFACLGGWGRRFRSNVEGPPCLVLSQLTQWGFSAER
jgi:hypothetical protein